MKIYSRFALIGVALLSISYLTAAQPDTNSAIKTVAADTPEATFDAMKAAAAKQNWAGFASGMTPASQEMMIGAFGMMSSLPGAPNSTKMKGLSDVMSKHGAKPIQLQDLLATGGDQAKAMELLGSVGKDVKDKPACIGDAMAWMEKNLDKDSKLKANFKGDEISSSTLTDVKIDGDNAQATIKSKDKNEDVGFKKIDVKWYMDMAGKLKAK